MTKRTKLAAARPIAGTLSDPTLPKTPVVIGGKTYDLCFDFGALAEAELAINRERAIHGLEQVNLLFALPVQNLANTRLLFAAALRVFHPDIPFDRALKMLSLDDLMGVALAIRDAFTKSMPAKKETPDPIAPGK